MSIRKAVFPAAGLGTRFLPATKAQPKEMLPLVDKPIIQYVIEEAVASGITSIIIVTGKGKNAIEDHSTSRRSLSACSKSGARPTCSSRYGASRTSSTSPTCARERAWASATRC
jgi:UTP-glucose-1-phosphate uridylyltransferase